MNHQQIEDIIRSFYDKAKKDILIGYHFRVIEDFDEHIPRIASFWELQLNKKITNKSHLPFDLISKHRALKINRGEVFRWMVLFEATLDEYVDRAKLTKDQKNEWMKSAELFKQRIITSLL